MISERLAKAINEQLNFELASGFIYKGMEAYFGKEGYDGFKHFMKLQAEEEYEQAQNALKILGGELINIDTIDLYGNTRKNILIKKVRSTKKKYPRGKNQPKKNPL